MLTPRWTAGSLVDGLGKILVANRGEIAIRVFRAAADLGLPHLCICQISAAMRTRAAAAARDAHPRLRALCGSRSAHRVLCGPECCGSWNLAGLPSVAVFSPDDSESLHVFKADEALPLGSSYLDQQKLIDAAKAARGIACVRASERARRVESDWPWLSQKSDSRPKSGGRRPE